MFFADFSVDSQQIFMKFYKYYFKNSIFLKKPYSLENFIKLYNIFQKFVM